MISWRVALKTCLAAVWLAATVGAVAAEVEFRYPPQISLDEVRQWIAKAPAEHPRLLARKGDLAAIRESIAKDPLARSVAEAVIGEATALRDASPITRTLAGRRLLSVSRSCVGRVLALAMAYHLTGDPRHAQRCEQEMLAAARFSDWNPSHFLDVGEMTFALAVGYDWLYDQLSPAGREEIRRAIVQKGVILPWETSHNGWVRVTNNWGQVCHGGVTAGALAVLATPGSATESVADRLLREKWGAN